MARTGKNDNALTDLDLQNVGDQLQPDEWKKLGRRLEVKNLQALEYQYRPEGLAEIAVQMLRKWMQQEGMSATREKLASVLKEINRIDIAEKILDLSRTALDLDEIQKSLVASYQHLQLPRVFWDDDEKLLPINELYVDLLLYYKEESPGKSSRLHIRENASSVPKSDYFQLEELFHDVDGVQPKRILIEGHPGFGKTTLVCKLATDWSTGEPYIREKFFLVLVLFLRYFEDDLKTSIAKQNDIDFCTIDELLQTCEEKILLILDGFDELDEALKSELIPYLKGAKFTLMTIILTTRTNEMRAESVMKTVFHRIGAKTKSSELSLCWNKRVQIKGISKEKREEFLSNYLQENDDKAKLSFSMVPELDNLYAGPLFLFLLAMLLEEGNMENTDTKTRLFKKISNLLISRNLTKEELIKEDDEIDIFNPQLENCLRIRKLLIRFGKLALQKLKETKLSFSEKDIKDACDNDDLIWHLGFLAKNSAFQKRKLIHYYEPVHKTFLEFFAAFYVANTYFEDLTTEDDYYSCMRSLLDDGLILSHTSLFCFFLVGLMGTDANKLFVSLLPIASLLPIFFLMNAFSEMENTEENNHCILQFIPPVWRADISNPFKTPMDNTSLLMLAYNFYSSKFHSSLLELANKNNIITSLVWDLNNIINIPKNFHVTNLYLFTDSAVRINNAIEQIRDRKFTCEEVMYTYYSRFFFGNQRVVWKGQEDYYPIVYKNVLSQTNYKKIRFEGCLIHEELPKLPSEFPLGKWKESIVSQLVCCHSILFSLPTIITLIKENKIHELTENLEALQTLDIECDLNLQALFDAAIDSLSVKSITLCLNGYWNSKQESIDVDFIRVCEVEKIWEILYVNPGIRWINFASTHKLNINVLLFSGKRFKDYDSDSDVLSCCNSLKAVSLSSSLFDTYLKKFQSRKCLSIVNITEMELIVDSMLSKISLDTIKQLQYLKILTVTFDEYILSEKEIDSLTKMLLQLDLRDLTLKTSTELEPLSVISYLLEQIINEVLETDNHKNENTTTMSDESILKENQSREELKHVVKETFICQKLRILAGYISEVILDLCERMLYMNIFNEVNLEHTANLKSTLFENRLRKSLVYSWDLLTPEQSKLLQIGLQQPYEELKISYSKTGSKLQI